MARHRSPGALATGPESTDGQRPVRRRCALAQRRTCRTVSGALRSALARPHRSRQKAGQRRAAGQPAQAPRQRAVHATPRIARHVLDRPGVGVRPAAGEPAVRDGPLEYPFFGQLPRVIGHEPFPSRAPAPARQRPRPGPSE